MDDQIQVSVIVPVHNAERYLTRCVDSLLWQTLSPLEIILIDDGSQDQSGKIIDSYRNEKNIVIVHQENRGVSAARNKGLELARGSYIGFCDNDDYVHPDYYRTMLKGIQDNQAEISVSGYVMTTNALDESGKQRVKREEIFEILDPDKAFAKLVRGEYPLKSYLWNKVFKKDLFDNIQFPEGKLIEDQFVTYKLILKAARVAVTDWKGYFYFKNPVSATNRKWNRIDLDYLDAWKEIEACCRKHYPDLQQDARDQIVSAAVYSYGRLKRSAGSDLKTEEELKRTILAYSENYIKSRLKTATNKRKLYVSLLRSAATVSGKLKKGTVN